MPDPVYDPDPFTGFRYQWPAIIDGWHDGDTCIVHRGDQPGREVHGDHVRVEGINAPELHAAGGAESLAYAETLAPAGIAVVLTSSRPDKYGRLLCRITLPDGRDFSDLMLAAGQAAPYNP